MDFSQPQRQSPIGIVVLFLDNARKYIRAFWPILIILFLKLSKESIFTHVAIAAAVLVILAVASYLSYRNFTFYMDTELDEFVVTSGVLSKTRTTIKLSKIQQVTINQSFLQRLIHVYKVDFDTAGSAGNEVSIRAVSHTMAAALKEYVLKQKESSTPTTAKVDEEQLDTVLKISLSSLIKTGLTSSYVRTFGLMIAFFFTIVDNLNHVVNSTNYEVEKFLNTRIIMQSIIVLVFLLVFAVLIVNLIRVVVKYYNYSITRKKNTLQVSFGLLHNKNTILKPERVQLVTVIQNYFQKKMNMVTLKIAQAGGEHQIHKQSLEIPACSEQEKKVLLNMLLGTFPEAFVQLTPNYRKLIFEFFLAIVVPLSVFFFLKNHIIMGFIYNILALLYTIFVSVLLFFNFKNSRLFLANNMLMARYGAWDITTKIVHTAKIQSVVTSQLFWHKPLNIGALTLYTAGGAVTFNLVNFSVMQHYVNLWLYQIESTNQDWM